MFGTTKSSRNDVDGNQRCGSEPEQVSICVSDLRWFLWVWGPGWPCRVRMCGRLWRSGQASSTTGRPRSCGRLRRSPAAAPRPWWWGCSWTLWGTNSVSSAPAGSGQWSKRDPWPFVDGLERGLVGDAVGLLQVQDEPGRPVGPLLRQVDPGRQPVPVEADLIGSQKAAWTGRGGVRRSEGAAVEVGGRGSPVTETMFSSLLMVCGLMSLNQSSVTISLVRSKDIWRVTDRCTCRRRYVSCSDATYVTWPETTQRTTERPN